MHFEPSTHGVDVLLRYLYSKVGGQSIKLWCILSPAHGNSYVTADARSMTAGVLSWHADWRQFTNKIWACLTKVQVCFMWLRDELFIGSLPSCRHLSRPAYSRQAPYIIDVGHRVLQRWLNVGPASWRWPNIEAAAGSRLFWSAVRYPLMACW